MSPVTVSPAAPQVSQAPRSFWSRHARELLGIALLALAIHDVFGPHGFIAMRRTQKEMEQLRGDLTKLNQENGALADQVKSLKTDRKTIERIAREEMGLARPGEMIIKLPPPVSQPGGQPASGQSSSGNSGGRSPDSH